MKTIFTILTTVALLAVFSLNAQVAINTDGSSPHSSAMLDIQSTTKGFSLPNLNISDMSTAAPVTSPKTGLVAFNTNTSTGPGIVMWTGTKWVTLELEGINWKLLGNTGTSSSTNFVGTIDNVSLPFRTNNTERMRVRSDGIVSVNSTGAFTGSTFYSVASGNDDAIDGNAAGTGDAIYGQQTGNGNAIHGYASGTGNAIYGYNNSTGRAVYGYQAGNGYAVHGSAWGAGSAVRGYNGGTGHGVVGLANAGSAFGVLAANFNSSGTGLITSGNNNTAYYLAGGTGLAATGDDGIYCLGATSSGTGIMAVGNNIDTAFYLSGGSGGAFTGETGVFARVYNNSTGTGVIGVGNNLSTYHTYSNGSGGAFTGTEVGVYGYASNTSGDRYGGYFAAGGGRYAYVGGRYNGTYRKIVGNGTVSTIVKNTNGEIVTLVCPEAPESLFQDYGIGQLINGKAHIAIDPDLAININVSPEHPLKVFITLEGDCKGVYVTNKSAEGFDVIELQGGTSNVPFSWQIVATRANEEYTLKDGTTEISDYSKRFQPAPGPLEDEIAKGNFIQQKALQQKSVEVKDAKEELKPKEEIKDSKK